MPSAVHDGHAFCSMHKTVQSQISRYSMTSFQPQSSFPCRSLPVLQAGLKVPHNKPRSGTLVCHCKCHHMMTVRMAACWAVTWACGRGEYTYPPVACCPEQYACAGRMWHVTADRYARQDWTKCAGSSRDENAGTCVAGVSFVAFADHAHSLRSHA